MPNTGLVSVLLHARFQDPPVAMKLVLFFIFWSHLVNTARKLALPEESLSFMHFHVVLMAK